MSERARTLIEQATLARRNDLPHDAHSGFLEAVALCRQVQAQRELIQALKGLGQMERDMGRTDAARPHYEEAVALCRKESDVLLLAHTIRHLGDIYQDIGRLDLAEPCYREALAIYRADAHTGRLDLANTLRPFAILQKRLGIKAEAIALWTEARNIYVELKIREGVAEGDMQLAMLRTA
jgi:tetratricopeptide (TPR) repeat protein